MLLTETDGPNGALGFTIGVSAVHFLFMVMLISYCCIQLYLLFIRPPPDDEDDETNNTSGDKTTTSKWLSSFLSSSHPFLLQKGVTLDPENLDLLITEMNQENNQQQQQHHLLKRRRGNKRSEGAHLLKLAGRLLSEIGHHRCDYNRIPNELIPSMLIKSIIQHQKGRGGGDTQELLLKEQMTATISGGGDRHEQDAGAAAAAASELNRFGMSKKDGDETKGGGLRRQQTAVSAPLLSPPSINQETALSKPAAAGGGERGGGDEQLKGFSSASSPINLTADAAAVTTKSEGGAPCYSLRKISVSQQHSHHILPIPYHFSDGDKSQRSALPHQHNGGKTKTAT